MRNLKIAAAVATALGAASAQAAVPTQSQSASTPFTFYMGGSSAAVSGFGSAVGADLCVSGTLASYVTNPSKEPSNGAVPNVGTPDFRAFSCTAAPGKPAAGNTITIYYRAEGGSVVGAYAPLNNVMVEQLNLATALCLADATTANQFDCATSNNPGGVAGQNATNSVVGNSPANGPADSYTGAVQKHILEYGISDVEPGALGNTKGEHFAGGGNDDPVKVYTFLGADATPNALQSMSHTLLFQQSFGFVANTNLGIKDISSAAVANILSGALTDWSFVPTSSGTMVASTPTPIVVCHRDLGSGTRTAADIVFGTSGCNPYGNGLALVDNGTVADSFSTGDVLLCVQANSNSIGYVSIDNFSKVGASPFGSVTALTLDGRTASNLLTATGGWQYAVEASANQNVNATPVATTPAFYTYLIPKLQALATAPQSAQVNALPTAGGNTSNIGLAGVQTNGKIHVTSYLRDTGSLKGNSCNALSAQ